MKLHPPQKTLSFKVPVEIEDLVVEMQLAMIAKEKRTVTKTEVVIAGILLLQKKLCLEAKNK